jgi:hypothetical protein
VGAAACRECHPGEAAFYARSGHHRTLWSPEVGRHPVVAWLDGQSWADPDLPEVTWSYHLRDGRLVAERKAGDRTETLGLEYGLGSGTHGVTFVAIEPGSGSDAGPSGIEHRLSYFGAERRMDVTPGQERLQRGHVRPDQVPWGRSLSPETLQQCLGCHSTLTSTRARNRYEPETLVPNVTCERCHGPGRDHVEAARRGETELTMRVGSDRGDPAVEIAFCGQCHRLPRAMPLTALRPDNLQIVRFQPVGLSLSSCYAEGLSGLRCVSCHDPHDRVSTDRARYESVCLSCHQAGTTPKRPACPVAPGGKCLDCHMPRREVAGNGWFTDHWIRKPEPAAPRPDGGHPTAPSARAGSTASPSSATALEPDRVAR